MHLVEDTLLETGQKSIEQRDSVINEFIMQ